MSYINLGGSKHPVAFCHYHHATLSVHQMKRKGCLDKQCRRLERYEHPYWTERAKRKALAKARRKAKRETVKRDHGKVSR